MSKKVDKLSPEIRTAEAEIDSAYKSNPLMKVDFATATWNVLGAIEDLSFRLMHDENVDRLMYEGLLDSFILALKHPIHWIRASCSPGGDVPATYNEDHYSSASALLTMAAQYEQFCVAFTYASRGLAKLRLEGNKLIPTYSFPDESRYQAYDRLIRPVDKEVSKGIVIAELNDLIARIDRSLKISGENFSFDLTPELISDTMKHLMPIMRQKFILPEDWKFSRYSLSDFKKVYHVIYALSYLQMLARNQAAYQGCIGIGFANCLYITTKVELVNNIASHTGLSHDIITNVLHDLTLGSHGMTPERADPALQPLIELNDREYVVTPFLWINSAAERNFMVLMNRIPAEKAIYSRLVDQKEGLMRQRIIKIISHKKWRTHSGSVPGRPAFPDIDLAIIDDTEKSCLLMELKWFIEPAEPREVIEKSEEIAKGVSQLLLLKKAVEANDSAVYITLKIDASYSISYAVVSANSIGDAAQQHLGVAVIHQDHLIEALSSCDSLKEVIAWLDQRLYLPIEGKDYEVINTSAQAGKWEISWYGIQPLVEEFMPLP